MCCAEVICFATAFRWDPEVDPRFKGKVYKVEEEVAKYCGLRHAVAVNSGTSALLDGASRAWPSVPEMK